MLKISQETIQDVELEHKLKALQTLHPPRSAKTLARVLVGMGGFMFIGLFLPWQQNIQGTGTVTALTPQDRPQTVQTAIAGRIISWNVQEGQFVKAKDTILTLSEIKDEYFDPQLLTRLSEQVQAKEEVIAANRNKVTALAQNIVALEEGLDLKLQQAQNKLRQARYKLVMDSTDYEAEKIGFQIANRQFTGGENMYRNGLISLVEYEKRKLKLQETSAKLVSMENKVLAARAEVINARIELNSISAEYAKEIAKANSDRSSALSYLSDAEGELSKLRNKLSSGYTAEGR
jgi:multidrug efflux pump subunit AcrA (membrane-fusion protein)